MTKNALVFDIWANHAYFRKGYTATSTISYPFPSRTTISGIIAAILGLERDSYYDLFNENNSKISIAILNPIKKFRMNLNYINTKEGWILSDINKQGKRTQVRAEFLKDVKYRIYVCLKDEKKMKELFDLISNHKSVYTPFLGVSECIANFKLVGDGLFSIEELFVNNEGISIKSVVPTDSNLLIESGKKYGTIKSPGFMNNERIVTSYIEYYYEENGKPIKISNQSYYKVGKDNVLFF